MRDNNSNDIARIVFVTNNPCANITVEERLELLFGAEWLEMEKVEEMKNKKACIFYVRHPGSKKSQEHAYAKYDKLLFFDRGKL